EKFFFAAAELAPHFKFLLGGEGWGSRPLPQNVRWIGHVGSADHNRINCSARMVLNINRDSMASVGFSPPTRVFEAAGAGACLITDRWAGIETFFAPEKEILVAGSAQEVVNCLRTISAGDARQIGMNMRQRALRDHTYALRAQKFDAIVENAFASMATIAAG
ncbi:MAG TPA: glycosyltransferase, partial [Candidatus Angelobacter sp.]|nr:glycosyltransferase [Candidatus Angelobacter sp.]